MRSVFEIGADLQALADLMDEAPGGELDPEAALVLDRWFADLAADQARKLDGYVSLIRHCETMAAAARETAERFARKAQAEENKARRLKQRLLDYLDFTLQPKAVTASGWTVAGQSNGGAVPLEIDAVSLEAVPRQFVTTVEVIDKAAIRSALAAGDSLPFARLGERGRHLRIRPA
jgi:hypothetical protein